MATKYARLFDPTIQFQTRSGALNTAGRLLVYLNETDDLAEVLDDGMRRISQPVVLDDNGRAPGLFVDSKQTYRLEVYDRYNSLMFTIRSMTSTGGGGGSTTSNYYPGDIFINIDQEMREISLKNLKRLRGDGETIIENEDEEEVVFSVNPDIIGDNTKVKAGTNIEVTYDSDNNEYTVNGNYSGSETVNITSDGEISGNYRGGYGIAINGNTIGKTGHRLVATNNISYSYCKVFDFTWQYVYGRGQCVFTATHYGGDYVTFAVSLTRAIGTDYTVAWPYVVAASPYLATGNGFVERLEIRSVGNRIVGYLKLNNFIQNQMWLDWEGSSNAGIVSFTPQLTNAPEGTIEWTRTVSNDDVFFSQYESDRRYQKILTAGENIYIDSDNVISSTAGDAGKVYIAEYGTTTFNEVSAALALGKTVTMRKEDSQEVILGAQYGGFFVYPDVNEYYFFALGQGGQRVIYRLNSEDEWSTFSVDENDGKVFVATYSSTLFGDIKNAIAQGKYVVAKQGSTYYVLNHDFDARIVFMGKLSLTANVDNFVEVDSDSNWTSTTASIPVNSFTAHGSVTTTDSYNDVGHTNSFAIGQKGTHGGVLDIGAKVGVNGWVGTYKVFTRIYHNSNSSSAQASGSTSFGTVTLGSNYVTIGSVSQYLLMTGVQWTYIVELAYGTEPGRSLRITLSGIGSTDITYFAEEIR